ncbi:dihydrolipoyllysine-residue acetyltransferase [Ahniella affigens]|uniref:dihydrolipoyllysine-residue acetyltransferase n=1 Tax=Ahniella affigens TaxID=2021234 RepID=UPI003CCCAB36
MSNACRVFRRHRKLHNRSSTAGGLMAQTIEAKVPDIGANKDIPIIELLVKVGDTVSKDQGLVTLESDKATMEVPAPAAGVVKALSVQLGDKVSEGSLVAIIEAADAAAQKPVAAPAATPAAPPAVAAPAPVEMPAALPAPAVTAPKPAPAVANEAALAAGLPYASPAVRQFARELGVDLAQVGGSGRKSRITREDVQNFVKQALSAPRAAASAPAGGGGAGLNLLPWPNVDFNKFGPTESKSLSRIKKISGANLARNWVMIPHVTQFDEADITDLEAFRVQLNKENEKSGLKLTMLAFLLKASVAALKKFPDFNASLDASGENLILKQYFHLGFAADTPNGLVVPVIRDVDQKGVLQIAKETSELAAKARDGKLGPADMQGGCFSISSLGGIGGTAFTPIINAPEVAILGVSKSSHKPHWNGSAFEPKLMLPLSLSYDHRVIDGAAAARFTAYLAQVLADFRRVML